MRTDSGRLKRNFPFSGVFLYYIWSLSVIQSLFPFDFPLHGPTEICNIILFYLLLLIFAVCRHDHRWFSLGVFIKPLKFGFDYFLCNFRFGSFQSIHVYGFSSKTIVATILYYMRCATTSSSKRETTERFRIVFCVPLHLVSNLITSIFFSASAAPKPILCCWQKLKFVLFFAVFAFKRLTVREEFQLMHWTIFHFIFWATFLPLVVTRY